MVDITVFSEKWTVRNGNFWVKVHTLIFHMILSPSYMDNIMHRFIYQECCAWSWYQGQGQVITSHRCYAVRCNYLCLSLIPASGTAPLICDILKAYKVDRPDTDNCTYRCWLRVPLSMLCLLIFSKKYHDISSAILNYNLFSGKVFPVISSQKYLICYVQSCG